MLHRTMTKLFHFLPIPVIVLLAAAAFVPIKASPAKAPATLPATLSHWCDIELQSAPEMSLHTLFTTPPNGAKCAEGAGTTPCLADCYSDWLATTATMRAVYVSSQSTIEGWYITDCAAAESNLIAAKAEHETAYQECLETQDPGFCESVYCTSLLTSQGIYNTARTAATSAYTSTMATLKTGWASYVATTAAGYSACQQACCDEE